MKKKIKLAFFSSTRGDIAIFKPLIDEIKKSKKFSYLFFAYGTHSSKKFGSTINEIKDLKIKIDYKKLTLSKKDNDAGLVESLAKTQKFANYVFNKFTFDGVFVLGDRLERIPIISNCIAYRKYIFHLHGGEITLGALDEQVRHLITKSAHLHFAISEKYKNNIIKMNEERFRVCNSGSLAIQNILPLIKIKKDKKKKYVIFTYHPETIESHFDWKRNFNLILNQLLNLNYKVIITAPGHEKNSSSFINYINKKIIKYPNCEFKASLGYIRYFNLLRETKFVIGNSSSGVIEVPYFKIPTINIGKRQQGRFLHDSVINCSVNKIKIKNAILKACSKKFNYKISKMKTFFGKGNASKKIINFIEKNMKNHKRLLNKKFYNA